MEWWNERPEGITNIATNRRGPWRINRICKKREKLDFVM